MIIITGASGFIGLTLFNYLKENNYKVKGYTRDRKSAIENGLELVDDYINIPSSGVLIHLAEQSDASKYLKNEQLLKTQHSLINHFIKRDYSHIIYTSSAFVYRSNDLDHEENESINEKDLSHPYAIYKLKAEKIIESFQNSTILRLSNVYGIGMSKNNVISEIIKQIHYNQIQVKNTSAIRDFIHIFDVVNYIAKIIDSKLFGKYNISSGCGVSIKDIIKIINNNANVIETNPQPVSRLVLSNHKINNATNTNSTININDGIRTLLKEI